MKLNELIPEPDPTPVKVLVAEVVDSHDESEFGPEEDLSNALSLLQDCKDFLTVISYWSQGRPITSYHKKLSRELEAEVTAFIDQFEDVEKVMEVV